MDKNIDDDEMVVIDNSDWGNCDWGNCDSELSDRLHTVETNIDALDSTVDRLRGKVNGLKQRVGTMSWCVIALSVVMAWSARKVSGGASSATPEVAEATSRRRARHACRPCMMPQKTAGMS